ncbi:hypothetical protein BLS_003880 [Venturia inaequalis]|uniref:Uncharacterized protein n=1 Tax=Venturia inaequalis TaxID=5025 RepID=A0A8H3UCN7_VENIN|nr:hypothetical protein EG328_008376 [Venturia inaequalis]KAE9972824.1 hypothetical protein BLS_003880 [Venturia inaequalis]KAE9985142.1 hypothetical protein EG327_004810 [Venturia inaequalis]RDI85836.1 hypothetical protein Vi05172_g4222 [Venturia inaequalis]
MSHLGSVVPTGLISLPLLKFSHSIDASDATKFSWKHELNQVVVIFDNYGADRYGRQPSSIMKVVQGAKLLDNLDLTEKVGECKAAVKHALEVNVQLKADQLPTSALYRRMSSTIALRYTLPDTKVRRMQFKFTSVQDFDTALAILEDVGCHLHNSAPAGEVGSTAPPRPSPASSYHSQSRDTFEEPHRPYTSSSEHFPTSQHIYRSYTSSFVPASQTVHSFRPSTPLTPIRENEPSIYSDPVLQNIGAIDMRSRRIDPLRPRSAMALGEGHSSTQSDPIRPSSTTDSRTALTGSSRFFTTPTSHERPSTAPFLGSSRVEGDLTFMIPPRRELPFKRPDSSRDGSSSSRPSTAADMKPLPTPTFERSSSSNMADALDSTLSPSKAHADEILKSALEDKLAPKSASKRRASAAKAPAPTRRPSAKPPSRAGCTNGSGVSAVEVNSSAFRSSSPPRPRTALNEKSFSSHDATALQLAARHDSRPLASSHFHYSDNESSHHFQAIAPPDVHLSNAIQQSSCAPMTQVSPNALPLNETLERSLARINSSLSNAPEAMEANKENLIAYSKLNDADRMSMVENMIISCVSDENFAVLAEDVYGCWQRIGLASR